MKKTFLCLSAAAMALAISAQAEPITALSSASPQRLITFDSATPATATNTVTITGLQQNERLTAIDFRPATGTLYGLSNESRIYSITADTGEATAVGSAGAFTLAGSSFGFDFNPVPDRIRITSDTEQNLRANPNDGTAVTDGSLAYGTSDPAAGTNPQVVGVAYVNNFAGAQATTLYGIDAERDTLVIQNPPNEGTLTTVGSLGVNTSDTVGFDVSGTTGVAYASLTDNATGRQSLFTINLLSGAATAPAGSTGPTLITPVTLGAETILGIAAGVNPGSRLRNISTRAKVGQGEDVLIGGFITRGGVTSRVILRGIGPSLSDNGVGTPLADPVLTLFDKNGQQIATNDNWKSDQQEEIEEAGLAPENDNEAAILASLAPGEYTVQVTGKGTATGLALVEIYQIDR